MDDLDLFGKYDDHGNLEIDVDTCILSGLPVEPGDATVAIGKYFYRVKAAMLSQLTADMRQHLEDVVKNASKPSKKAKE